MIDNNAIRRWLKGQSDLIVPPSEANSAQTPSADELLYRSLAGFDGSKPVSLPEPPPSLLTNANRTADISEAAAAMRLSNMLRQDYAPPEPAAPKYPPLRGIGYRIPIIPPKDDANRLSSSVLGNPMSSAIEWATTLLPDRATFGRIDSGKMAERTIEGPISSSLSNFDGDLNKSAEPITALGSSDSSLNETVSKPSKSTVRKFAPPASQPVDERAMLKDLEFDPNGPSDLKISVAHPIDAYIVNKAATEALRAAIDRFTRDDLVNGPGDAFRHALWNYKLARSIGPELAKKFTDAYEVSEPNASGIRLMDLYSNFVGRRLAADPKNHRSNDEMVVMEALRKGELQTTPISITPGSEVLSSPTAVVPSKY